MKDNAPLLRAKYTSLQDGTLRMFLRFLAKLYNKFELV